MRRVIDSGGREAAWRSPASRCGKRSTPRELNLDRPGPRQTKFRRWIFAQLRRCVRLEENVERLLRVKKRVTLGTIAWPFISSGDRGSLARVPGLLSALPWSFSHARAGWREGRLRVICPPAPRARRDLPRTFRFFPTHFRARRISFCTVPARAPRRPGRADSS